MLYAYPNLSNLFASIQPYNLSYVYGMKNQCEIPNKINLTVKGHASNTLVRAKGTVADMF